jgi:hypothetical protein
MAYGQGSVDRCAGIQLDTKVSRINRPCLASIAELWVKVLWIGKLCFQALPRLLVAEATQFYIPNMDAWHYPVCPP